MYVMQMTVLLERVFKNDGVLKKNYSTICELDLRGEGNGD
jgi:hypothetical protein